MAQGSIDSETLYRNVVNVLEHGQRTATYKLATLAAIIDYCRSNQPTSPGAELSVPIPEIAQRVLTMYWRQSRTFDGRQLRQSTQPTSRILDAVGMLRVLSRDTDYNKPLDAAALKAPIGYRRAIDDIGLCLAQQPLPRLQRLPPTWRSLGFLYDDSFLSDTVSRSQLLRHNNAIRLRPLVAEGLAVNSERLMRTLRAMWVDDILRLNHLPSSKRELIEEHLFEPTRATRTKATATPTSVQERQSTESPARATTGSSDADSADPETNLVSPMFASHLNYLFRTVCHGDGNPYSSGEAAAWIRQTGSPMTVSMISQLRAGVGEAPSKRTIEALAKFFAVPPSYFEDGKLPRTDNQRSSGPDDAGADTPDVNLESKTTDTDGDTSPQEIFDNIEDVLAACTLRDDCWIAPTNDPVRCRTKAGADSTVMEIALHRWSWMVDHRLTANRLPVDQVRILRTCGQATCCNPDHLYAATMSGLELTPREVALILEANRPASPIRQQQESSREKPIRQPSRFSYSDSKSHAKVQPPLHEDLAQIEAYCNPGQGGCWLMPTTSPVPCRADDDDRPDHELPRIKVSRWSWMVANRLATTALPTTFQVWRHCENSRCANPDHLYLTGPDGDELSADDAEELLRSLEDGESGPLVLKQVDTSTQSSSDTNYRGRHRAAPSTSDDSPSFADKLNALFDGRTNADGSPYTTEDAVSALQNDGFAVAVESIERLRSGAVGYPDDQMVAMLAFHFDEDPTYFRREGPPTAATTKPPAAVDNSTTVAPRPVAKTQPQVIPMSVIDLGRIVVGLSEAMSECLARNPADIDLCARLALVTKEVGALLTFPVERSVISRALLRRIVTEWRAVGYVSHERQPVLPRIAALLDED